MNPGFELFSPPLVFAPSPADPAVKVSLEISPKTLKKLIDAHLRVALFQGWAHVVGELPPVPNWHKMVAEHPHRRLGSLKDAHACFRGVHRPYGPENDGETVFVYVIATPDTVGWVSSLACVADIIPAPEGTLMTVQVRGASALQPNHGGVWGTITKWEFVRADPEQPLLPNDFANRYGEQLWLAE
jgi:hypothetical protein